MSGAAVAADRPPPHTIGVVISTFNQPEWLRKTLWGFQLQRDADFTVYVADDGSGPETAAVIAEFDGGPLRMEHVWQEDRGFRKCAILNKVIARAGCDYLIFTDGDCIPPPFFVATHRRLARPGTYLSGGYIKLTSPLSRAITAEHVKTGACFDSAWLIAHGQPRSRRLWKLVRSPRLQRLLNALTPAAASWNGMNSSTWTEDLRAVNGFNEDMHYGGEDRELGERLRNYGLRARQIRYSTVCLHLDHPRGYADVGARRHNDAIRRDVRRYRQVRVRRGIQELGPDTDLRR